jgi:alpha-galactosidase
VLAGSSGLESFQAPAGLGLRALATAPWRVTGVDGQLLGDMHLDRSWQQDRCRSTLTNRGTRAVRVGNIVLFDVRHGLAPATRFYGEGFQMLTQNGGTVGAPADLGNYTDPKHYRLPQPDGARVVYGLATFAGGVPANQVMALTSCRRFNGAIHVRPASVQVVLEAEGLTLGPGETWDLEEFIYTAGPNRAVLVVLLWTPRHRATGARQPGRHREAGSRAQIHPDRRRLSTGDG